MPANPPTPHRQRSLRLIVAIVAIVTLTGCDAVLSERYGYPVTVLPSAGAPQAWTRCARSTLGHGSVNAAGQVLRCVRSGRTRTWAPQREAAAPKPLVLVYGDSIAQEAQLELVTRLGTNWAVVHRVFGGTAPCDYSPGVARDIRAYQPTVVVTSFTGNNMTPCMQANGTPLDGAALEANYQTHLAIIATTATAAGARVVIATSPLTSDPSKADRVNAVAAATLAAAHTLATTPTAQHPHGQPVFGIDTGATFRKPGTDEPSRIGAQWLPCKPDGSEASSCVQNPIDNDGTTLPGGWAQVHTPLPDGLHLCPIWDPRPGFKLCPVRNIGAERYADALHNAIITAATAP